MSYCEGTREEKRKTASICSCGFRTGYVKRARSDNFGHSQPPRHGKSLIANVFWPAWVWAQQTRGWFGDCARYLARSRRAVHRPHLRIETTSRLAVRTLRSLSLAAIALWLRQGPEAAPRSPPGLLSKTRR